MPAIHMEKQQDNQNYYSLLAQQQMRIFQIFHNR